MILKAWHILSLKAHYFLIDLLASIFHNCSLIIEPLLCQSKSLDYKSNHSGPLLKTLERIKSHHDLTPPVCISLTDCHPSHYAQTTFLSFKFLKNTGLSFLCTFVFLFLFPGNLVLAFAGKLWCNTSSVTFPQIKHSMRINNFFFCKTLDTILSLQQLIAIW